MFSGYSLASGLLPVMENFYTLQGEGYNMGMAAWFIRLAGCNMGCGWCDVKESWDKEKHPLIKVEIIVEEAAKHSENVVITGGEPLLYNLDYLCRLLQEKGCKTFLETSGSEKMSGSWNWVCVSPKIFKKPLPVNLASADELKIVVNNKSGFEWAEKNACHVSSRCKLFLQPEWSKSKNILPEIIEYIKKNPKWKLSLQTHKFIGIP